MFSSRRSASPVDMEPKRMKSMNDDEPIDVPLVIDITDSNGEEEDSIPVTGNPASSAGESDISPAVIPEPCLGQVDASLPVASTAVAVSDDAVIPQPCLGQVDASLPVASTAAAMSGVPEKYEPLGDGVFMGASYFNGRIIIHIRQYAVREHLLIPTKVGVTMGIDTWMSFKNCIHNFKFYKPDETLLIGRKLLVHSVAIGGEIRITFQLAFSPSVSTLQLSVTNICLSKQQFQTMMGCVREVSKNVNVLNVRHGFPAQILQHMETTKFSNSEDVVDVRTSLMSVMENFICDALVMPDESSECPGCDNCELPYPCRHPTLLESLRSRRHSCDECMETHEDPMSHECPLVERALEFFHEDLLPTINLCAIADSFVNQSKNQNKHRFLEHVKSVDFVNLCFEVFWDVLMDGIPISG